MTPAPLGYLFALFWVIDYTHTNNPIELWLALGIAVISLTFQINYKKRK